MKPKHGKLYKLTKREAKLMAHVVANFHEVPFTDDELAESIGWPVAEVRAAMEVCAAFGLLDSPDSPLMAGMGVSTFGKPVSIDDLLTPAEKEEATRVAGGGEARPGPAEDRKQASRTDAAHYLDLGSLPSADAGLAALFAHLAARSGLMVTALDDLVDDFRTRLETSGADPANIRGWIEPLKGIAAEAEGRTNGAAFAKSIRGWLAAFESDIAALDGIADQLEAAGWAWKDGRGEWLYPTPIILTAAELTREAGAPGTQMETGALLAALHDRLLSWCRLVLADQGCPPELLDQQTRRERHLIEDVLSGPERLVRPIPYPDVPPPLRSLVSIVDGLQGMCVVAWYRCDHSASHPERDLAPHFAIRARVLEDGRATATELQDWGLEHRGDGIQLTVATDRDDRREIVLQGQADPERVAEWLAPLRDRPAGASPDPDVAARREAGWKALRAGGWLTIQEVMDAVGIETNDPEVEQSVLKELAVPSVSVIGMERLFDPVWLWGAVQVEGVHVLTPQAFPGRYRYVNPWETPGARLLFAVHLTMSAERGETALPANKAKALLAQLLEEAEERRIQRRPSLVEPTAAATTATEK